mmetsp:Transcript_36365/g.87824  ORF Transcript_36365/g.87824 Transcript_36365/m.87824 type:complete len:649 (+) Transcript_36365:463-2409(+)
MFRRRKNASGDAGSSTASTNSVTVADIDPELQDKAQDVMKDNLELMKDIVMRVRDDPDFAKGIYKDCPRLQHLLEQYPDLRPIFEDPKLVKINFEQVYREAGGVLPEDEEKKKRSWLVWIVNSPIFKVLKLLLFVKKLVACIAGGGFAFVSGLFIGCCFEDALEELDGDADADADADGDMDADPNKEALNRAADHMEDPEVQEQMQRLLEDPDNLQEAIENDSELRQLRDSNPLCEELMSDPDTMRVLVDPDNLRALGDAPSLIEMDFVDPDSFIPDVDADIETGGMDDAGFDADYDASADGEVDIDVETDADAEVDLEDQDDGFDAEDQDDAEGDGDDADGEEEEEDDEGWWEDGELEDQEVDADADNNGDAGNKGGKGKAQAKSQAKGAQQQGANGGGAGNGAKVGIMAAIGAAATDIIAAQIVGSVFGDDLIPSGFGGGGGNVDMGGEDLNLDDASALDDADIIEDAGIEDLADDAGDVINDDVADVAEDVADEADEGKAVDKDAAGGSNADMDYDDEDGKKKTGAVAGGAAAGGVAGGAAVGGARSRDMANNDQEDEDNFDDEAPEEEKKKSRFGFGTIKSLGAAVKTAALEHVAGNILGEDFGEGLVERMEEGGDSDEDEDDDDDDKKSDKPKKRGMFGRGKK